MSDAEKIAENTEQLSGFTVPDLPPELATALKEGVEYVDATALLTATLQHTERLHNLVNVVANALGVTQRSLIRAHKKLIELEADMAMEGIASNSNKRKSQLIPPPGLITN